MPSDDQNDHMKQQEPLVSESNAKTLPNSNLSATTTTTISNELANMTQAFKEKKKLVRRAFSMPRNLFRLSRRVKNNTTNSTDTTTVTANDCNQSIDPNQSNRTECAEKPQTLPASPHTTKMTQEQKQSTTTTPPPPQPPQSEQDNKHRLFRRSTWKKFLFSRFIVQTLNLKVNIYLLCVVYFATEKTKKLVFFGFLFFAVTNVGITFFSSTMSYALMLEK